MKKILSIILIIFCLALQLKAGKSRKEKQKSSGHLAPIAIQIKKLPAPKTVGKPKPKRISNAEQTIQILKLLITAEQPLPEITNPILLRKIITKYKQEFANLVNLAIELENFPAADKLSSWTSDYILQETSQEATMDALGAQLGSLNV